MAYTFCVESIFIDFLIIKIQNKVTKKDGNSKNNELPSASFLKIIFLS